MRVIGVDFTGSGKCRGSSESVLAAAKFRGCSTAAGSTLSGGSGAFVDREDLHAHVIIKAAAIPTKPINDPRLICSRHFH